MSLLSELSRGYGSWTAGYVDPYYKDSKDREPTLPEIDTESHVHGVTVSTKSGRSTAMSWATRRTREHTDDSIHIPKTFSTRRGALQLFVAPDDLEDEEEEKEEEDDGYKLRPRYMGLHRPMGQELIDLSLKLGTLERLASSVLQFGDKEAESEEENISHEKNKAFLKFLHQIDGRRARMGEHTLRPGEDLNTYLRDLRSSSSMRFHSDGSTYLPKNRESQELQAILRGLDHQGWPMAFNQDAYSDRHSSMGQFTRPVSRVSSRGASPGPPSTPRSSYQVLSSKKLAASLKSLNYLGRPSSRLSVDDDVLSDIPQPVSAANVTLKGYSPAESVDEDLVAMRNTGFWGSTAGSTVGDDSEMDELKKRRLTRLKEKSHLTYSETLYQVDEAQEEDASTTISYHSALKAKSRHSVVSASETGSRYGGDRQSDISQSKASDSHSIAAELESLGLGSGSTGKKKGKKDKVPGGMHYTPPPPGKRPKAPADKLKIPDHLKDALKRRPSLSFESLERDLERRGFLLNGQVTEIVGDTLSGPTLEAVGEGLTQEELELAKIILQKKIDEARNKIDGKEIPTKKKAVPVKSAKKGGKKKKDDVKTEEELEREAIQARHAEASKKRDAEAAELQRKIAERRALLQAQGDQASAKSKEIREKMEALEREAEDLQRAEDEARDILADVRKKQREEREARRRADLERKKNEAADRRERERKEIEEKRQKEIEMMEKIADAEMRRRLREEEERKAEEEERLAQERYEEEMKENARLEEEAEERMKEMERQAEEEAMQRLIFEREEAERERRKLREEEERMREEERMKMEIMEREAERLEAEQRRIQEEEDARREMERNRLMELQRLELEARQKMQEEIEVKRQEAMSRRDFNLDNRMHVDKLRHNQGITRAWTFSYFVRWPRDTYERLMGSGDPRKTKIKNPRPKPVDAPPPMEGGPSAPEVGIPKP